MLASPLNTAVACALTPPGVSGNETVTSGIDVYALPLDSKLIATTCPPAIIAEPLAPLPPPPLIVITGLTVYPLPGIVTLKPATVEVPADSTNALVYVSLKFLFDITPCKPKSITELEMFAKPPPDVLNP